MSKARAIGAFVRDVKAALEPLANAKRALGQSAYMRNQFVYLGIDTEPRRATQKAVIRAFEPADCDDLREAAQRLWAMKAREYQYVAVDLLVAKKAMLATQDLAWILELAQLKSWWDSVDSLVHVVGTVVRKEPGKGQRAMDRALRHEDFWVRRVAMLHQLGWRAATDTVRLFRYADVLAPEKEFFIRKAVGWALRDYAWHNPEMVRTYLERERAQLSGLTYREAAKHC
jgi:3-methyladenine DNA glycosylase AlkD